MFWENFYEHNKKTIFTAAIAVLVILVLIIGGAKYMQSGNDNALLRDSEKNEFMTGEICVHVKGAVINPGLYTLARGSRINDAVLAAGGASPEADLDRINLARHIDDGQELIIPGVAAEGVYHDDGRVNINTASSDELCKLPGIGEALAARIIAHREKNGSFGSVDDLKKVSGIGNSKFKDIEELVKIYD